MTHHPRTDDPARRPWVGPSRPDDRTPLPEVAPRRAALHDVSDALLRPDGADQAAERGADPFDPEATRRLLRRVLPPSLVGFLGDL